MKTWVYLDHFQGHVVPAAWEALGLAQRFGLVTALIFGENVANLAEAAFEFGADDVLLVDDSTLSLYRAESYASTLTALAAKHVPALILLPSTTRCREMAAMSAMDLGAAVLTDVLTLEQQGDDWLATRPIYEGKLYETVLSAARLAFVTVRARAFACPARQPGKRGKLTHCAPGGGALTVVESESAADGALASVELANAAVVVAGGRGVLAEEDTGLVLLNELAATLGGVVAASKPPVEAGKIAGSQLVGQSGKIISPELYVAVGISGAAQHLAGIRSARVVVAINKDAQAPIFTVSRYGVVGDLFHIIPALITAFKKRSQYGKS